MTGTPLPHVPLSRERMGLLVLRIGLGIVWALNCVFILAPSNQFFPTFAATASSFGPATLGGSGPANFVAAHPALFAGLIAGTTIYLAFAFLTGFTLRLAVLVGCAFNLSLLLTQWGMTFVFPGGTDVGPMPLYLVLYLGLLVGDASRSYSLDAWLAGRLSGRPSTVFRWIGTRARRGPLPG
jgi:hypothetical protein